MQAKSVRPGNNLFHFEIFMIISFISAIACRGYEREAKIGYMYLWGDIPLRSSIDKKEENIIGKCIKGQVVKHSAILHYKYDKILTKEAYEVECEGKSGIIRPDDLALENLPILSGPVIAEAGRRHLQDYHDFYSTYGYYKLNVDGYKKDERILTNSEKKTIYFRPWDQDPESHDAFPMEFQVSKVDGGYLLSNGANVLRAEVIDDRAIRILVEAGFEKGGEHGWVRNLWHDVVLRRVEEEK